MLKNYFRTALRNLFRNKIYGAITIGGIAIGLAAFWLITLYIADELSYDRYHKNADRIYRVAQHAKWDGGELHIASTSLPFAPALQAAFPQVEEATRILPEGDGIISYQSKTLKGDRIYFADANVFKVFSYKFLVGDPATALSNPQAIVLTKSLAQKIFGDPEKALNQTIYFENNFPNLVTGVIEDVPQNSHLQFEALRSFSSNMPGDWQNFNALTYLLLKKNTTGKILQSKLPQFAARTIQKEMGISNYSMELQPLTSIHLHSQLQGETGANGNMNRIYIFMAIAVLILFTAVINYMNLSTARSSSRVKEVGVRQVLGSGRKQLVALFIIEALVMTLFAALIAFFLVSLLLPFFNSLADKQLTIWRFGTFYTVSAIVLFAITVGTLSGVYPAVLLSRFKTIPALKGQMGTLSNNIFFRKCLIVFQFIITVVMIAASLVIYQQMKYVSRKNLGFNKDAVLTFHIHDRQVRSQIAAIKNQLLQNPLIKNVAVAGNPIGNNDLGSQGFVFENNDGSFSGSSKLAQELMVDADYLPALEIQLAAGRNFIESSQSDKYGAALVNETLVKELGWENPVGKRIKFAYGEGETGERRIVGVVKDFHTYSLQHKVDPIVLMMPPAASQEDNLYIKINTKRTNEALAFIEKVYRQFDRNNPIEFHFLDQNFARQYATEQKQEKLSFGFASLAILIACLGLFGLAAFTARRRIKEIGIRKVLGATVTSITLMLGKDFIKLVCISIVIAIPIAWWVMNKWLQDFAYRIDISWTFFAMAGLAALLISVITVSFQAIKAAIANPVKSLRTE